MGVWLKQTFHDTPLPLCHETSVCSLEVSALIRGTLPRPWGEGGRRTGEGDLGSNTSMSKSDLERQAIEKVLGTCHETTRPFR